MFIIFLQHSKDKDYIKFKNSSNFKSRILFVIIMLLIDFFIFYSNIVLLIHLKNENLFKNVGKFLLLLSLMNKIITVILLILFGNKGFKYSLLFKFISGSIKGVKLNNKLKKF
jgi:hypothetical protein